MIFKIINRFLWFLRIGYRYFYFKTTFIGARSVKVRIHKSVKIKNSLIAFHPESELVIEEGTILKNINLSIKGSVQIGKKNIINNGNLQRKLPVLVDGNLNIGHNNRIQSTIMIRFGGSLFFGNYNNINSESEIRVDENIQIGDFNQISYKVILWDTNTHNIYSAEKRREIAIDTFPIFGHEYEKPKTKPVKIGSDCWIGREVSILKGVTLSDKCIVGFRTILSDCKIEESHTIVSEIHNKVIKNQI